MFHARSKSAVITGANSTGATMDGVCHLDPADISSVRACDGPAAHAYGSTAITYATMLVVVHTETET